MYDCKQPDGRQNENIDNSRSIAFLKEVRTASRLSQVTKKYISIRSGIPLVGFLSLVIINYRLKWQYSNEYFLYDNANGGMND
jgi:hypothetical protein